MKIAECTLTSLSPYCQGKPYTVDKLPKELAVDYEERTWRERCHADKDGQVFIPPMALSNNIKNAAGFDPISITGRGKSTYTKHFVSGIMCSDPLLLDIHKDEIEGYWMFVPSDGKRGGGTRVWKCFPRVLEWSGKMTYYILDDIITEDIFAQVIGTGGNLIGIGSHRVQNGGYYGRFKVDHIEWIDG